MNNSIPVVILCGGKGTRLREETEFRPKPIIQVGDRPIIWHIMKTYSYYGYKNFMLCLGYKGEVIREYFYNYDWNHNDIVLDLGNKEVRKIGNGNDEADWKIWMIDTGQETMTGGRLKRMAPYLRQMDSDLFMATYGDGVCNVNIEELVKFHHSHGKLATVTAVRPPSRFGELVIEDAAVNVFKEKPQTSEGWINGGYFVLHRKVLDLIEGDETVFEAAPLKTLAALGELVVYQHNGFWQCMDTYRELEHLNKLCANGKAAWQIWNRLDS
ncbi:glucose-1-phosphate cytidylyltransferase [Pantanalinema rosaneae CENA516]|uniref:glucose-1-phosphate cytidylyltransferase n=1 Tax=Pantanalinema rosaneae TaxID=1620701 RepID=UPI003D6F949F